MKAILQRVASASVTVDSQLISSIGKGVLVFAAVAVGDTRREVESMAAKVLKMKLWPDETGETKWMNSVQDIKGEVLCVSQFTLLASTKKGNKPDFHGAADGEKARELYDQFYAKVQELYDTAKVKNGVFQAMMEVDIKNDGPVTLEIITNPPQYQQGNKKTELGKHQTREVSDEGELKTDGTQILQTPAELLE